MLGYRLLLQASVLALTFEVSVDIVNIEQRHMTDDVYLSELRIRVAGIFH